MAKLIGPLKLRGAIDDLCFRQTEFGNEVGLKPGPSRERVLHHKDFHKTRLNLAEFKNAMAGSQLLRRAMAPVLSGRKGSSLNGRMNGLLYKMGQSDKNNRFGERGPATGNAGLLVGFQFNKTLKLEEALKMQPVLAMDVMEGTCFTQLPAFRARKTESFPAEATHFRLVSAVVAINFAKGTFRQNFRESELWPFGQKVPAMDFQHALEVQPEEVMLQVMGMDFYKLEEGNARQIKGSAMQIMAAVRKPAAVPVQVPAGIPVALPIRKTTAAGCADCRGQGLLADLWKPNIIELSPAPASPAAKVEPESLQEQGLLADPWKPGIAALSPVPASPAARVEPESPPAEKTARAVLRENGNRPKKKRVKRPLVRNTSKLNRKQRAARSGEQRRHKAKNCGIRAGVTPVRQAAVHQQEMRRRWGKSVCALAGEAYAAAVKPKSRHFRFAAAGLAAWEIDRPPVPIDLELVE